MHEPPKVLIVDDDPGVTLTFARMLRLDGFTVSTALTAEAGLRQVSKTHPDAVVLDLYMPLVDGLEFLRQLRAQERPHLTPVAIVTGHYFMAESVARELRELNAAIYFKPLWIDDLLGIARHLIAS
jgi:DNA-binding response OmpR family regulator